MYPSHLRVWQRAPGILLCLALVVAGLGTADAGAQTSSDCPVIMPTADVRAGMIGTGVTVAKGRQRENFNVEVLGVIEDAFPGRDLIVVDTSGGPIDQHGGIWYGMSGSPVYIDGKLVGAVAFGLSFGPSTVGALTPAEEMMRVLEYPSSEEGSDAQRSTSTTKAQPSGAMAARIAARTGQSNSGSFEQLKVPVGVSGGSPRVLNRLSKVVEREGLPIVPFAGSSASLSQNQVPATAVQPGDNLVAALSYGDITFAGLGTATFACNGQIMAFGHPFFWQGETTMGANAADSIVVGGDDFFTFEVASIAESIGMIDQDRFAGLRATTATLPTTIPINSSVTALNNGRSRDGTSSAVISEIVPFLSWAHLSDNILFTMDQFSGGSSTVSWTVTGTTVDGSTWDLSRSNMYTSRWGIAYPSTTELAGQLFTLFRNKFTEIEFTGIDVDATVTDEEEKYQLVGAAVSKDGITFKDSDRVRARPGQLIHVRATLKPFDEDTTFDVDLQVQIPDDVRSDGVIELGTGGGRQNAVCLYRPGRCVESVGKMETLEELIAALETLPKNNELLARLRMGRRARIKAEDREALDRVVKGIERIYVSLGFGGSGPGEEQPTPEERPR
ncbi:MAG: hypothetical protein M3277_04110 [Actinomycetota bacterium]|nr:hypothetical protein [Actinomycetota bacterium]